MRTKPRCRICRRFQINTTKTINKLDNKSTYILLPSTKKTGGLIMKKAFLITAGVLFALGNNTDASAHPNIQAPAKVQAGHHANDVAGTVNFISRQHHRRHNQSHFRGNRHGRHFGPGYRGHRQGYNRHNYRGWDPYRLLRPYGNHYSYGHFYRGRDDTGYRNPGRHGRHYGSHHHRSPRHRH